MALNDHFLKYHFNSWWTGKLSDFAGLFFFPLFLCASGLLTFKTFSRREQPLTAELLVPAIVLTNIVFVAVKMVPEARAVYEATLTAIGFPSRVTPDGTDLAALSSSVLCYAFGRRFWRPTQYRLST